VRVRQPGPSYADVMGEPAEPQVWSTEVVPMGAPKCFGWAAIVAKAAFLNRFISPSVTRILGVVRARSVHKAGCGHNPDGAAT